METSGRRRSKTRQEREQERHHRLYLALEEARRRCDVKDRLRRDPVGFVHRYASPLDQELMGLAAACIAFGNVATIRAKLEDLGTRLGPSPAQRARNEGEVLSALEGWVHRVYRGEDLARLLLGAARVQESYGSLGVKMKTDLDSAGTLRGALTLFCEAIRREGGFPPRGGGGGDGRRGADHLLPDPGGKSGLKRLLLYLRWMVRPADGVDLGLWPLPPKILLCPVDTHIHNLALNLGLTRRKNLSLSTTEEITAGLARFDPEDPAKYDFALCHLGMLQRCPSRRDPVRCQGCPVMPVCRHWEGRGG